MAFEIALGLVEVFYLVCWIVVLAHITQPEDILHKNLNTHF